MTLLLSLLAVVANTSGMVGAMCQGILWTEFFMASTRIASASFRLKRARSCLSISIILYVALATLLLVLELVGRQQAESAQWLLSTSFATSTASLFLYGSHKMASQHCERVCSQKVPHTRLPFHYVCEAFGGHKRTSFTTYYRRQY